MMYHRIAEPVSDVWEISVSSENFAQHLQVLKKACNVIPLKQMAEQLKLKKIKKSIAITFDDGTADNFLAAKPLLEQYQLPATFFITSCNIGHQQEFWWDELENIFLFSNRLPRQFSFSINNEAIDYDLENETNLSEHLRHIHTLWKATLDDPPTLRCRLFLYIWQALKPLPHHQQQTILQHIKEWAKVNYNVRPQYTCMSVEQLQSLSNHPLFDIGVHTSTHPALAFHDHSFQKKEISDNKKFLEDITGKRLDLLSYPYGNYNNTTINAVRDCGLSIAFTTEEDIITKNSNQYKLGRYQVKNLRSSEFQQQINKWITSN